MTGAKETARSSLSRSHLSVPSLESISMPGVLSRDEGFSIGTSLSLSSAWSPCRSLMPSTILGDLLSMCILSTLLSKDCAYRAEVLSVDD